MPLISTQNNPFVHNINLTSSQKIQVLLMSVTIAPVRLLLAFIMFAITWCLALLFTIKADTSMPASPFRQTLYNILQWFGRANLFVCGFQYIKTKGRRASYQEAPILLVIPHSSIWDIIVFFVTPPLPSALSKVENFRIPVFGTLMKAVQPILVHRNDVASKLDSVNQIKRRLASDKVWPQLVIFPEGTCTNKKVMLKFKLGAFLAGNSIQPVIIRYQNNPDISTWTEISPSAFYLIWLTFCQIKVNIEIEYLPVYKPSEAERNNSKLFAGNVQHYLAEVLDVPCSDLTYEDRMLMKLAGKLKMRKESACIGFFDFSKTYNVKIHDVLDRLKEFAEISSRRSFGIITKHDLCVYLKIKDVGSLDNLITTGIGDVMDNEELTFTQYLTLYYTLAKQIKKSSNLCAAYNVYRLARVSTKNNEIVQEVVEAMGSEKLMSDEEFALFNPFYTNLLLLQHKDD